MLKETKIHTVPYRSEEISLYLDGVKYTTGTLRDSKYARNIKGVKEYSPHLKGNKNSPGTLRNHEYLDILRKTTNSQKLMGESKILLAL